MSASGPAPAAPGRLLVVDDNSANLHLLTGLLAEHGFLAFPASDGELALEFARATPPDLVLLDIKMPGMDGYEVCRRLKADPRTRDVPVIFISALESEGDRVNSFRAGGVDYVSKPFRPEEVLARVETHLALRRAQLDLERRNAELAAARAELEERVLARTAELAAANARLEAEIAERERMQEQMLHSQKMETIGLLAGGVAHDFNNLLAPILAYSELVLTELEPPEPWREMLADIRDAARNGQALTQRLLAFSRKQRFELKLVDLGELVRRFEGMLRRTLREDITIRVDLAPRLGAVRADAAQLQQVLANLSVNAQDAMAEGGTLAISAKEVELDAAYAAQHPEAAPGRWVLLAVSDSGAGMDAETQRHIFEPFFTTKEHGRGTGLGLPTAFGIVKQHGGFMTVYSEPGQGSTFKVFLPVAPAGEAADAAAAPPEAAAPRGSETVVVAEDDESVRRATVRMLASLGYRVLEAGTAERCIELVRAHPDRLPLLVTDVVMPGMNGRELFDVLRGLRPELKVLFMSGYPRNVGGNRLILEEGVPFIQKPFSARELAVEVRAVLDAAPAAPGA